MNLVKATPFRAAGRSTSYSFTFSFGAAVGQTLDKPQHCILRRNLRRSDTRPTHRRGLAEWDG